MTLRCTNGFNMYTVDKVQRLAVLVRGRVQRLAMLVRGRASVSM